MDVPHPHSDLVQVVGQFLRHAFGKCRHKDFFVDFRPLPYLLDKVVYLVLGRTYLYRRVEKAGRPHQLLDDKTLRPLELVVGRSGADVHFLGGDCIELVERQRPVVRGRRKPEPIFDKDGFPGMVAAVHRPNLGYGDMALVNECDEVLREIVYQAERPLAGLPAVQVPRIILDPGAVAHLPDHLYVILHPLLQPLGFQRLAYILEILHLSLQVLLDETYRLEAPFPGSHEVGSRKHRDLVQVLDMGTGHRIDKGKGFDLVSEEFYPHGLVGPSKEHVDRVTPDPECTPLEIHVGTAVVCVHQVVQETCKGTFLPLPQKDGLGMEILRVPYSVKT